MFQRYVLKLKDRYEEMYFFYSAKSCLHKLTSRTILQAYKWRSAISVWFAMHPESKSPKYQKGATSRRRETARAC